MDWGKKFRTGLLAAGLGVATATVASSFPAAADLGLKLTLGRAVFWPGVHFDSAAVSDDAPCTASTCPTYALNITGGAARLRVAIDNPVRANTWTLEVLDPSGKVAGSDSTNNQFASEVFVDKPAAGTWTVRVVPTSVTDTDFRLRAKLERTLPTKPAGKVALLPNLKTVPPYEFGFIAPANPLNAVYPPDTVNPPLDVAGVHPLSCAADEMAPVLAGGGGATRCLRLTSGPINVGSGPFDMLFDFASDTATGKVDPVTLRGPMRQVVHYSDGSVREREAGTYSFHKTHAHFHTDQVLTYQLFGVDDVTTGKIHYASVGTKSGFCPADQLYGDWDSFTQERDGTFGEGDSATGGSCFSPEGGQIGLSVGWGDIYRWQRPGQYVEFGGQPDGLYLVRTTADADGHVVEENENDNTSYALIDVEGERVKILERGQGMDPWDKHKVVFSGEGPAAKEMAAENPVYVEEAAAAAPTRVDAVATNRGVLPRTGGVAGAPLVIVTGVAAVGVVLRRRILRTPPRSSR